MYGVKPQLINIILGAGIDTNFVVTCGLRTHAEQVEMVRRGVSQTLESKHLTGDAVDLAVCNNSGKVTWEFPRYVELATIVKAVAKKHGVAIVWGGDWRTLRDGPHFELAKESTDGHSI